MIGRWNFILICLFTFFNASYGNNNSHKPNDISSERLVQTELSIPFNLSPSFTKANIYDLKNFTGYNIVSITEIKSGIFVACDYGSLFVFHVLDQKIEVITPPEQVKIWNPTGVYYNKRNNNLYVANYHGKNILVFKLTSDNKAKFLNEITFPGLISPENVSVTNDGELIAIADYDGSKIYLVNKEGQVQWSYPVRSAHGVCIEPDGSNVYATGLDALEGQIYKINKAGTLLAKQGLPEYQKKINFFTYPTHCALSPTGELYYVDAHIGGLVSVNKDTLERKQILGTYGPAFNQINVSYGFTWGENGKIYLSDMYKERFIEIDPHNNEISNVYYYEKQKKEKSELIKEISLDRNLMYTENTRNVNKKGFLNISSVNLPSDGWIPGYKTVINMNGTPILIDLRADYTVFKRAFQRFLELKSFSINNVIYSIISSPQNEYALLIKENFAFPLYVGRDFWLETAKTGEIYNLIRKSEDKLTNYNHFLRSEENPLKLLHSTFFQDVHKDFEEFMNAFSATFSSNENKNVATSILEAKDKKEVKKIYETYLFSLNEKSLLLEEILLMKIIKHTADVRLESLWDRVVNYFKVFFTTNWQPTSNPNDSIESILPAAENERSAF